MGVLASEILWYKGSLPLYKVSEITIVSEYAVTGRETESWNAPEAFGDNAICYRMNDKLTIVCDTLVSVGDKTFKGFLTLEKITGLNNVATIGDRAFCLTPKLSSVDINPSLLTSIGESAFKFSGVEDFLDLSAVSLDIIGDNATRRKRWSDERLAAINNVEFPATVKLDVPNLDCQMLYPDVLYGIKTDSTNVYGTSACASFACYHAWNHLFKGTDKQYDNWLQWYNGTINSDGTFAENNTHSSSTQLKSLIVSRLGWSFDKLQYVDTEAQLEYIIDRIIDGLPVITTVHSNNNVNGKHTVAIVGCDANTRKLAIVDSAATDDVGAVYWVAFEDMFIGGTNETDRIVMFDYNFPILAPNCTWFTRGGDSVARGSITEIEFVDSYTPNNSLVASWDASNAQNGSITVYVEGTKLTLAGNGSGKIFANPDSSWVFSDSTKKDYFSNLTKITGGAMFDTRLATTLEYMFNNSKSLVAVDVSNWKTHNVTSMKCLFQNCYALANVDVGNWETDSVTSMLAMFNMTGNTNNNITFLDLSSWDVSKVTTMQAMFTQLNALEVLNVSSWDVSSVTNMSGMFRGCRNLKELDFSTWDNSIATATTTEMFNTNTHLEKVNIGEKFNIYGVLPTPSSDYIMFADGNWYDVDYNAYAANDIPSNVARTYYASRYIAAADDDKQVLVNNGTLVRMAMVIRSKTGKTESLTINQMIDAIDSLIIEVPDDGNDNVS